MRTSFPLTAILITMQFLLVFFRPALASTFEQRIQDYMNDVLYGEWGKKEPYQRNSLWAYFMRSGENSAEEKERIHIIVRAMVLGYEAVMPELGNDDTVGFFKSIHMDNALIYRVLLQFRERITQEDYDWVVEQIRKQVINDNCWLIGCNGNSRIQQLVGLYLYGEQFDRNASITFWRSEYMGDQWVNFSYEGRSYQLGLSNHYNAYQFAKDYLQYTFDLWVNTRNYLTNKGPVEYWEFDSGYSHAYLTALAVLYDLAQDPIIKQKAKMALDLWILDYFLDYSPIQHGGGEGRAMNPWRDCLDYILLGVPRGMHPAYPSRDFFTTTYRMPEIVEDLVDLSDEPDSYFHIHREYNPRLHEPGKGKKTFVTKYCTLGGGCTWDWELNLGTLAPLWRTITLTINDMEFDTEGWWDGGQFFQYRNFLSAKGANLNCSDYSYFEKDENQGDWRFLKLGKAMVAINGGVEVCIEGADYATFEEFKQSVLTNASPGSMTSKRINVTVDENTYIVYANGIPDDEFPYKRMETVDNNGNVLVDWNNNQLFLSKHGRTSVYDFNNWTWFDGSPDDVPPNEPNNLHATAIKEKEITLAWDIPTPASDGDGADHYLVYRNKIKVAAPTLNIFNDINLKANQGYFYEIFSVDDQGNPSSKSASGTFKTLRDTSPAGLVSVRTLAVDKVLVTFNETLERASVENINNYSIVPGITVISAILSPDSTAAIINTSPHQTGITYTLSVNSIKDRAEPPNTILNPISMEYTLLTDFCISEIRPARYDTMRVKVGDRYYIDRDYVVTYIPNELNGLLWVRTANDDKELTEPNFLTFIISKNTVIYIAYDNSALKIPLWLTDWQKTNKQIETTDAIFQIYSKEFAAGKVTLGGNEGNSKSSMYLVLIDKLKKDLTPPAQVLGVNLRLYNGK